MQIGVARSHNSDAVAGLCCRLVAHGALEYCNRHLHIAHTLLLHLHFVIPFSSVSLTDRASSHKMFPKIPTLSEKAATIGAFVTSSSSIKISLFNYGTVANYFCERFFRRIHKFENACYGERESGFPRRCRVCSFAFC
jgi:hypothetical protein